MKTSIHPSALILPHSSPEVFDIVNEKKCPTGSEEEGSKSYSLQSPYEIRFPRHPTSHEYDLSSRMDFVVGQPFSLSTSLRSTVEVDPHEAHKTHNGLVHRLSSSLPSTHLLLENTGSVARDHLASERTFLAYVSTGLTLASTGVALVQLFTVSINSASIQPTFIATSTQAKKFARPLGAAIVMLGIVVLNVGLRRYFTIQSALMKDLFPVARLTVAGIAVSIMVMVLLVFVTLISAGR